MARAIWKGTLQLDSAAIAVKLYSAVQDRQIRFHLLHGAQGSRIRQRMVNPSTGAEVPAADIRKGYPVAPGRFVVIEAKELTALEPKPSRAIEITRFVPAGTIGPQWYDRPYYVGPDGPAQPYFALLEALAHSKREAVVRWVMRKKAYKGALRAHGDHLLLSTLRAPDEVVDVSALKAPEGRAMDARELALGEQLIAALQGEFEPTEFKDDYRARVLALIDAKAKGKHVKLPRRKPLKPSTAALSGMLRASLRHIKERASA